MRAAATLAIAFLLLLFQSTMLEVVPFPLLTPNLGLLVVLHVALSPRWAVSSAAIIALGTGYLHDLVSGTPQGVHALVFILVALLGRLLSTQVAVRGVVLTAAMGFVASLVAALLTVLVRAQVAPEGGYGGLTRAPVEALLTGLFAPLVLGLLKRVEGRMEANRSRRVGLARGRVLGQGSGLK